MKTGKTPYEIRSDLLHLAHRIVQDRKHAECAKEAMDNAQVDVFLTKSPTAQEVIDEAEKLNSFVSQSTDHR